MALRRTDWTFVMVGKATVDVTPLRGLANVRLLGQKPYETLPAYCRAFDVGIIPFRVEELTLKANPLKLREYLAAGLPTVAFAPSLKGTDLVDGQDLLISEADDDALLGALHQLADDPQLALRLGRSGRAAIEERYSWEDGAATLQSLLEEAVSERARRRTAPPVARTPA
jgi:glycosyltransferase involved in cell wall biosynthesis